MDLAGFLRLIAFTNTNTDAIPHANSDTYADTNANPHTHSVTIG